MLEQITTGLLLKGLEDITLNKDEKASLAHCQTQLLTLFQQIGSPNKEHVGEIVTLAIT